MPSVVTPVHTAVVRFDLPPPFDVDAHLDYLGRRTVPGVESLDGRTYTRTMRLPNGGAIVRVALADDHATAHLSLCDPTDLDLAVQRCRWLLDLDNDPTTVDAHLSRDPVLAASVAAHPGLRVPGHVDGFEAAVRAIVGQQISVAGARTLLARMVLEYGDQLSKGALVTHLFPSPAALAGVAPERLPMPRSRGRALATLADAVATGRVVLDRTASLADTRSALLALPGIGPWTADYIALRALGDPNVFLSTDLGVRHGLTRLGVSDPSPQTFERWAPWRSYALMHVWKALDGAAP
jgi:AraC family transcriptional regulator of adaptative response / DNA-3-methyladenine glycosylase II